MKLLQTLGAGAVLLALGAAPALADPGKGRHHKHGGHGHSAHCPPGLAKKMPACVPPGQVGRHQRDHVIHYGNGVGDVLRVGNYTIIRDLDRYGLQNRDNWRYYRDGDHAYRVDSQTNKVLAVLNLMNAFAN